jgi:predicted hydrocarbon binding protein
MVEAETGFDCGQISALQQALEDVYGLQGARGITLRSGRAAFCYLLKALGEQIGFDDLEFRLLPPRRRMQAGLERLAQTLGSEAGGTIQVQDQEKAWLVRIEDCPECRDRQSETAMCFFSVGLLQEFLTWLSGGKVYLVEEITCRGRGDAACTFRIDKKPLD